ncbi:PDDEXK nuclease domain-containing protein [Cellulosimicrobium sp. AB352]|uniref:PDDEXK nuclease domain-containing protein n=1 Tax=unclassified Cellulosimicrobium TaxID=2624466 RepID=UPI000DF7FA0D|nr:PDDEXK nuclease domain-containing protein [Cellulosimicrobium sp. 72-3]
MIFHVDQLRYVVVELKIGKFDSGHVGQLGTYVALVDDRLRKPDRHAHTVGILLVAGRDEAIVRYALAGAPAPLAMANDTYDSLPPDEHAALPLADELTTILEHDIGDEPAHET